MVTLLLVLSMLALAAFLLPLAGPWTAMQVGFALLFGGLMLAGGLLSGLVGVLVAGIVVLALAAGGALLAVIAVPLVLIGALAAVLVGLSPLLLPLALLIGLVWLLARAARRPAPPTLLQLPAPERALVR